MHTYESRSATLQTNSPRKSLFHNTIPLLGAVLLGAQLQSEAQSLTYQDLNPAGASESVLTCVTTDQQGGYLTIGPEPTNAPPPADPLPVPPIDPWPFPPVDPGPPQPPELLLPPELIEANAEGEDLQLERRQGGVGLSHPFPGPQAALWSNSPDSVKVLGGILSWISDLGATNQVGMSGSRAALWSGTAESEIQLSSSQHSEALGIHKDRQVGEAGGHAVMWMGTAESMIDLHPPTALQSRALAVHGNQQVGWIAWQSHAGVAALWSGSAASAVNLHPGKEWDGSEARATTGHLQAGSVWSNGIPQAAIWRSTASSFKNLNPAGAESSAVNDAMLRWQVGWAEFEGARQAIIWRGTQKSALSLHQALAEDGFEESVALGIWTDGHTTKIAGFATTTNGNNHAILWTITAPPHRMPRGRGAGRNTADGGNPQIGLPFKDHHCSRSTIAPPSPEISHAPMLSPGRQGGVLVPEIHPPAVAPSRSRRVTDFHHPRMTEATAMPSVLSPANDQMVTVTVEALAKDNSGGVDWRVFSISCNKPHTADDLSFINDNTVQLRAAKSADGEDRIYTVWVRAEDAAGNLSQPKSILITVPHDRSNKRR